MRHFLVIAGFAATLYGCDAEPPPLTDADCQNTYWCTEKGRCHAQGTNCVATTTADCEASSDCKSADRCELRGGACHKSISDPCVAGSLCTTQGYCVSNNKGACCNNGGWCCTAAGNCSKG